LVNPKGRDQLREIVVRVLRNIILKLVLEAGIGDWLNPRSNYVDFRGTEYAAVERIKLAQNEFQYVRFVNTVMNL
jgi:hypothetical protein